MKKIYSTIAGFFKHASPFSPITNKPLPSLSFGLITNPINYLHEGWLRGAGHELRDSTEDNTPGWEPYFKLEMLNETGESAPNASWSVGKQAAISLPIPECTSDSCFITMRLTALLSEANNHRQAVSVKVNNENLCNWLVDSPQPISKLLVIPTHFIKKDAPLKITFTTPDSTTSALGDQAIPSGQALGVELYDITVFDGATSYLADLQRIYDEACKYRNELIEIEGDELIDRGELVDIIKNVLMILDKTEGDFRVINNKLQNFLSCPYLHEKANEAITFDQKYLTIKHNELKEGIIEHEIISWRNRLFRFKEAVLDAGNYAFRKISTENHDSFSLLDNFLQTNRYPDEKLNELKNKNEILNNLEILLQKTAIESIPPYLEIEMTSFCNFRCVMCSRSMMKFLHTQQNDQQILQISKILPFVKYVTIAGVGEPCASKKLNILSKMLELFKCSTLMFTNGSLLHNQLDAASRFARVNISFDGPNEKILSAQRRNSKFSAIIENIKKLKAKGTSTVIAFNVVVSRINVDEVAAIIKLAGELGINSVSLSPVVNVSLLELKESDRSTYEEQMRCATAIAKEYGVAVHNNVHHNSFSSRNDTVRDKAGLIRYFGNLKVPDEASHSLEQIIQNLEKNEFTYYPAPVVFIDNNWPDAPNPDQLNPPTSTSAAIEFKFDIEKEIKRLDNAIEVLEKEVLGKPKDWFKLPYCLSVWKYGYVKSNGKNRLCPHRNVALGNYRENEPDEVLNSPVIKRYRASMLSLDDVTTMCKECFDHHRTWSIDRLKETSLKCNLDLNDFKKVAQDN